MPPAEPPCQPHRGRRRRRTGRPRGKHMTVTRSGVGPLDLRLRVNHRFRPVEMVAPGFVEFDTDRPEGGDLVRTGVGPRAPFGAVEVHPSGAGEAAVTAGWATVDGDAVFAEYDAARRTVAV